MAAMDPGNRTAHVQGLVAEEQSQGTAHVTNLNHPLAGKTAQGWGQPWKL